MIDTTELHCLKPVRMTLSFKVTLVWKHKISVAIFFQKFLIGFIEIKDAALTYLFDKGHAKIIFHDWYSR